MMCLVHRMPAAVAAMALTFALVSPASAAPTAVELVFEQPFFAKIETGAVLSYHFTRTAQDTGLAPSFEDDVKLNVTNRNDEKAIMIELYSGTRARSLGPMPTGGNPMVITMLEQDVAEMQKVLGGSSYYIRNRMRDAINAGDSVEPAKIEYQGRSVDGWKVTLKPFANDKNREKLKGFADRSYEMLFSDQIPGGLYQILAITPKAGAETPLLVENLTLTGVAAAEAKP